jgi:TonB family protein
MCYFMNPIPAAPGYSIRWFDQKSKNAHAVFRARFPRQIKSWTPKCSRNMVMHSSAFMKGFLTRYAILWLTAVAFVFAFPLRPAAGAEEECVAIYAPIPGYPQYASARTGWRPQGKGLFICRIDAKTGHVTSVSIAKSTGFAVLDDAAINGLKRWKFRPNCTKEVKIPVNFSTTEGRQQVVPGFSEPLGPGR